MSKGVRDNFAPAVKTAIAQRVNFRCSNPTCGAPTAGPRLDPGKALNIGVAAHIIAAAARGPRFNTSLPAEERKAATNGIWLCQNCAKLIDNDEVRFPEGLLRRWKAVAEQHALSAIGQQSPFDRSAAPALAVVNDEAISPALPLGGEELSDLDLLAAIAAVVPPPLGVSDYDRQLLDRGVGSFGQPYVVIGTTTNHAWDWDIVFLSAGEFGWEVVAQTRLESQKGCVPEVLYVPGSPGALAITHLAGYGTGVLRRSTSWYRIARGEPQPLLSYPVYFYIVGWGLPFDRFLTTRLIRAPSVLSSGEALELEFRVEYTISRALAHEYRKLDLFLSEYVLSMEWSDTAGTFIPRTSADDFSVIDELWGEATDGFVQRNRDRIAEMVSSGTREQRLFIQRYLLSEQSRA
jgi:hypothetical protein